MNAIEAWVSAKQERDLLFVLFRDRDPRYKVDESGFNKVGYVTSQGDVVHIEGRAAIRSKGDRIERLSHRFLVVSLPAEIDVFSIEKFFTKNVGDPHLFEVGTTEIAKRNFDYFANPIRLPQLDCIDEQEHEARWEKLIAQAGPGDVLFTINTGSLTSRFIAWVDSGVWSHAAAYSGEGTVFEAITKLGVCERPLSIYMAKMYRVGLYRWARSDAEAADSLDWFRRHMGDGYSYQGAFVAGLQKYLGIRRTKMTPNDMAAHPEIRLIMYV